MREIDDMLAGAATDLNGVAGLCGEELHQHGADRLTVAVKGRRVEPPVSFARAAILAEFNDILRHVPPSRQLMRTDSPI